MTYWINIKPLPANATLQEVILKINEIIGEVNGIGAATADEEA